MDWHAFVDRAREQLGCLVKPEQRRDEIEQRRRINQLETFKVAATVEVPARAVPLDSQPVVQRLKWKLDFLANLQFHDYQPTVPPRRKQINKSPLLAAIGGHLRVSKPRVEGRIQYRDIPA